MEKQEIKILSTKIFKEFQEDVKYGNKQPVNIIMALLINECSDLSQNLFNQISKDKEDLEELLFVIPKEEKYHGLLKKIITQLFFPKGFSNQLIMKFHVHFSDSPEVRNFYIQLERDRIQRVNYSAFA
jgi:hypothetical protein